MAEAWMIRGYMLPEERLYYNAIKRLEKSPRLIKHKNIIMKPNDENHLRWVTSAKVKEIELWTKRVLKKYRQESFKGKTNKNN